MNNSRRTRQAVTVRPTHHLLLLLLKGGCIRRHEIAKGIAQSDHPWQRRSWERYGVMRSLLQHQHSDSSIFNINKWGTPPDNKRASWEGGDASNVSSSSPITLIDHVILGKRNSTNALRSERTSMKLSVWLFRYTLKKNKQAQERSLLKGSA